MKIQINQKTYQLKKSYTASAKRIIDEVLSDVRYESVQHGVKGYYFTFVVMMYVISSSILKNMNLAELFKEAEKEP